MEVVSMFEASVLKVLLSSPGDTGEEVAAVKESLHGWNGSRAESAQVILLPRHWKSDGVPPVQIDCIDRIPVRSADRGFP
jgi:hypothetical protein